MSVRPHSAFDTLPAARVARTSLLASFALMAAILAALFAERQWLVERTSSAALAVSEAMEVSAAIDLAGARMAHAVAFAVETGDPAWIEAFEAQVPRMSAAIERAHELSPPDQTDRMDLAAREANDGLVAHHRRILRLLQTGWPEAARGLLESEEFMAKRTEMAEGIAQFTQGLRTRIEAQAESELARAWITVLPLVAGACLALGLLWHRLGRALRHAQTVYEQHAERRALLDRELTRKAGMLERSGLGTWVWLPETDELQLNPLARELLRLPQPPEANGSFRLAELSVRVHPEDLVALNASLRKLLKGELAALDWQYRLQDSLGEWLWVSLRGSVAERDSQGRAIALAGTALDVTERQTVLQRWRARADLSGDFFWQTDADRHFTLFAGTGLPGLDSPDQMLGERALTAGLPLPLPEHAERLERAIAQRVPYHGLIYRQMDVDGHEHFIEVDARPRHDPSGRFLGFEGVGRDVTERLRVMNQLEESLRLVDALLEAIPLPVAMKSAEGRYLRHNRAFAELSGLAREGEAGFGTPIQLDSAAAQRHREADLALLARPGSTSYELTQQFGNRPPMEAMVHKSTVTGSRGEVMGIVATTIDITQQKAHARALTEACHAADAASRAKSAFLAAMSHEIRTPMNGVLGMSELLSHTQLDAEQSQTVHMIRESATALLRILDDILDFSKIEAGRLALEDQALSVQAWLDSLCESLAPVAAQREVRLTGSVAPTMSAIVIGDEVRLRQIVLNLAGNAIKFSGGRASERGDVRVRVERRDNDLCVEVQDNGIGIAADKLEHLFTPFTQAEADTTRRYGGTGLGLAISQRLARMMAGDIDVASTLGVGSTFTLRVPLRVPTAGALPAAAARIPTASALPQLQGVTVRLVPHPAVPESVLREWLGLAGATVLPVQGEPGAETAGQAPPTVVVAEDDDNMRLQAHEPGQASPWLLIGHGQRITGRLLSARTAGLDVLLRGPFLRTVAMLAGRASPEASSPAPETLGVAAQVACTVHEAEARGQLILVAEDDAVNQTVILKQLALLGHAAEVADNGAQALQMWRSGRYALLLSDLHMPEMDGHELIQTIRAEEIAQQRPRAALLALTANALKGEATRSRQAGFDDYLTKPLPLKRLQAALKRWMPKPRPMAEPRSRVLDLQVLRELVSHDEAAVQELLGEFLAHAAGQLDELAEAVRRCDTERARGLAHSLKSSSRSIGALPLGNCCEELERHPNAAPLLPTLQECSRLTLAAARLALQEGEQGLGAATQAITSAADTSPATTAPAALAASPA